MDDAKSAAGVHRGRGVRDVSANWYRAARPTNGHHAAGHSSAYVQLCRRHRAIRYGGYRRYVVHKSA
jgi:hypothetical protein